MTRIWNILTTCSVFMILKFFNNFIAFIIIIYIKDIDICVKAYTMEDKNFIYLMH